MGDAVPATMTPFVGPVSVAAAGLIAILVAPGLAGADGDIPAQAIAFAIGWLTCLVLLARRTATGPFGAAALYLFIFGLFHGGLLFSVALRGSEASTMDLGDTLDWLYGPYTAAATRLVLVGMFGYTITIIVLRHGWPRAVPERVERSAAVIRPAQLLGLAGLATMLAGLLLFVVTIEQADGLGVLNAGYGEFLDAVEGNGALGYATLLISIGAVLSVVAGGQFRVCGWVGYGAFAALAFPLGTRGAVLFPLAVLVAMEVRRGLRLSWPVATGGLLALLTLIGTVRLTRSSGVGALVDGSATASPLDAVAEMGHSLRPVVVVLSWHANGEPYRGGITLVAVFIRLIERLTGWHGGPPAFDNRLFNEEILIRVGAIGGSPVAEGYHNFGLAGVIGVMSVTAVAIGLIERAPSTLYVDATLGVVLVPLFTQIRNSSAPVLTHIGIGLVIVTLVRLAPGGLGRRRASRLRAPATQAHPPSNPVSPNPTPPSPARPNPPQSEAAAPSAAPGRLAAPRGSTVAGQPK
jgi:O-antigen polysaccharide polymerase Wzy